jgi:acyl-CoA thioester hydrolase
MIDDHANGTTDGTVSVRVRYSETDQMGVAYHAHYLVWCELGRTELMRAYGVPYAGVEQSGILLAVADASLRYVHAARYDDVVRITTRIARVRSRTVTFAYHLEREAPGPRVTLATAETRLIALAADFAPRALPRAMLERFRELVDAP